MPIKFENTARNIKLIDTGTEINIITLDLARRVGFPIQDESKFINIISQTGHSRGFYGMVKKISVKIGSAINTILIWVVEEINNEFVFEIFYIYVSRMT